jgi:DNA-binding transcriptional MerR regulator
MIRACQRVGLSIAEIRTALAELPEGHIPGPADWDRRPSGCATNCVTASMTSTAPAGVWPELVV